MRVVRDGGIDVEVLDTEGDTGGTSYVETGVDETSNERLRNQCTSQNSGPSVPVRNLKGVVLRT